MRLVFEYNSCDVTSIPFDDLGDAILTDCRDLLEIAQGIMKDYHVDNISAINMRFVK